MKFFNILMVVVLASTMELVQMVSINKPVASKVVNATGGNPVAEIQPNATEPSGDKPQNSTKTMTIAVAGDSQTVGLCPASAMVEGEQFPLNWPTQLQAKLNSLQDKKYNVSNFAVSASTIMKPLGDHDRNIKLAIEDKVGVWITQHSYSATHSYQKLLESKPDVVLMMMGMNGHWIGWPRKFRHDYSELIKSLQNIETKPEIFVLVPVQLDRADDFLTDRFHNTSSLQIQLAKQAGIKQNHIIRVDQLIKYNGTDDLGEIVSSEFACDRIHFKQKGMDTIANAVVQALQETGRIPSGKDLSQVSAKTCHEEFAGDPQKIEECRKFPHGWQGLDPFP